MLLSMFIQLKTIYLRMGNQSRNFNATENYTTISNGKVYVVQRPGDAGSVYDDAFWEEAHYRFVVTDKLFENGMPL